MGATTAKIKTSSLINNYSLLINNYAKDKNIIAIVKANAYGHGAIEISKFLERKEVSYLGVANLDEALELKNNKIRKKILILGSIDDDEIIKAIKLNIMFTVYDYDQISFLASLDLKKIKFHLKVDTGMNRLGISIDEVDKAIKKISNNRNLIIEGIYTHLAEADKKNSSFTKKQIKCFESVVKSFNEKGFNIKFIHASNSSGILNYDSQIFNTVRPGLFLYGLSSERKLKPAMTLESKIIKIRVLKKGDSVSYGRTFVSKKKMVIGVIPIGYADGLPRALSNKGYVYCKGKKCKILGRVCMDLTMIDITNIKNIRVGQKIVIFDDNLQSASMLASTINTIPYDIVCGISKRVMRSYT